MRRSRVRSPSAPPILSRRLISPALYTYFKYALVAQWIEHPPPKRKVVGSIPTQGANISWIYTWRMVRSSMPVPSGSTGDTGVSKNDQGPRALLKVFSSRHSLAISRKISDSVISPSSFLLASTTGRPPIFSSIMISAACPTVSA